MSDTITIIGIFLAVELFLWATGYFDKVCLSMVGVVGDWHPLAASKLSMEHVAGDWQPLESTSDINLANLLD